jgi:hypothetical protein
LSSGGFDPPHLESLVCSNYTTNGWFRSTSSNTASMLPLHYKRLGVKSAPPSHKSVIDFTMSRSTISMTFLIINPINRLNDFLPYGIYYHYCDKCPTFAHYQSLITFVALPKYHRVALTKAPMNSCHWMVLIHLPWSWSYQYASITLQWRVLICAPKRKRLFPSASDCFQAQATVFHRTYLSQPSLCPSSPNHCINSPSD